MRGDLGAGSREVHDEAGMVLDFWFGEIPADKHFVADEALDRKIAERFGAMRDTVLASGAQGWRGDPATLLAAVILLDQFSRNIHRDRAEAFAGDVLARELVREALAKGWDEEIDPEWRAFLYMPLMHAEDPEVQSLSLARFERLGDAENLRYAHEHADVITRFGRFPSRNAALWRESTPAEQEYLSRRDADW